MKKFLFASGVASYLLVPLFAFAQVGVSVSVGTGGQTFGGILLIIGSLIQVATPIVVALALLAFFWGLAVYIFNVGNEENRKKGMAIMLWGIIALFVMIAVWGLVALIANSLGIGVGGGPPIPGVLTPTGGIFW